MASELLPQMPLSAPVGHGRDGANLTLGDGVAARCGARQEQDFLLGVRRQVQQVHDLRHAGPRHVAEAGQVGVVADCALADEAVEVDGQISVTFRPTGIKTLAAELVSREEVEA